MKRGYRAAALMMLLGSGAAWGEGSFQTGLNQPLQDFSRSGAPLWVDIVEPGEVINVSLCGERDRDDVRIRIYAPSGARVVDESGRSGNVACNHAFDRPLTTPFRYVATEAGAYRIELDNLDGERLIRFDVSVTPDRATDPDPSLAAGRLWAQVWAFNAGTFDASGATDADFFTLVPGGRPSTNYVWLLDLNRFAGFKYWIVANDIGVEPPRSGYSVPVARNRVTPRYPIYLGYPVVAAPRPVDPPLISGFLFVDDAGEDHAISPGTTPGVQDGGVFRFVSDVEANYAITIDTSGDGLFGAGDVLLLGRAGTGLNEVPWSGRDGAGDPLPPGHYRARLQLRMGEYHFIASDAETSGGDTEGLTIFLANPDGGREPTRVYWDDATFLGGTSTLPHGVLSSLPEGRHTWGNFTATGFGNERYIDTYVYGLEARQTTLLAITADDAPATGSDGTIELPASGPAGRPLAVTVIDSDLDLLPLVREESVVTVVNSRSGEREQLVLMEEALSSHRFSGSLVTATAGDAIDNDGTMIALPGDELIVTYQDRLDSRGQPVERTARHLVGDDSDGDGVIDILDLDSDNDGIPDAIEGDATLDSDGDGVADFRDLDSDNDGLFDLIESGITGAALLDGDGDGRIDPTHEVGTNGLADVAESTPGSGAIGYLLADSDSDGVADFRDLDSDNDGLSDLIESGGSDPDGDGRLGIGAAVVDDAGLLPGAGLMPQDSDGDGVADFRDNDDSDGDGIPDRFDLDADNDGIPNTLEGGDETDSDGDGTPDYLDTDSDGDGLPDLVEAGGSDADGDGHIDGFIDSDGDGLDDRLATTPLPLTDSDGDGTPDHLDNRDSDGDGVVDSRDLDSDNDAIPDAIEGDASLDSDGDGVADFRDLDSDNDGVTDLIESGLADPSAFDLDGDGRIDPHHGVGANGLADGVESSADSGLTDYDGDGRGADPVADSDGDGRPDYLALDSDGDGLGDLAESGGSDSDGDGRVDGFIDADGDGLDDRLATSPLADLFRDSDGDGLIDRRDNDDSDGDGHSDAIDLDDDNDGIPDALEGDGAIDSDGDGVADSRDLDSDNDGLFDLIESGLAGAAALDDDGDGRIDPAHEVGLNGLADVAESTPDSGTGGYPLADGDGDGVADFRDLDSDNDAIPDVTEAGGNDPDHDGRLGNGGTANGDGLLPGAGLVAPDSDGDGVADFRDRDSDDDGLTDLIEGGGTDADGDGRFDGFVDADGDGLDDRLPSAPLPLPDRDGNGLPDYRDRGDLDGDGISDAHDLDDDNDGIPDALEGDGAIDSDGDGVADSRDLDSDNDGLFDLIESGLAGAAALDGDGDGRIDPAREVGLNGLADVAESTPDSGTGGYPLADGDGDGVADFRDLDSDNDGIPDVTEAGGSDPDHDGRLGNGGTANGDGLLPGAGLVAPDSDGDGVADFRDRDSDDDGLTDLIEGGGTDADGDGRFDGFVDADGDGLDDRLPSAPLPLPDRDGDGLIDGRDGDSDGDGVSDLSESGGIDRDLDGRVDDPVDADGDGFDDRLASTPPELPDSDGDGLADHLDRDSAREPPVVRTGLDGVGGCALATGAPFDPTLLILLAGAWLALRHRERRQ